MFIELSLLCTWRLLMYSASKEQEICLNGTLVHSSEWQSKIGWFMLQVVPSYNLSYALHLRSLENLRFSLSFLRTRTSFLRSALEEQRSLTELVQTKGQELSWSYLGSFFRMAIGDWSNDFIDFILAL